MGVAVVCARLGVVSGAWHAFVGGVWVVGSGPAASQADPGLEGTGTKL